MCESFFHQYEVVCWTLGVCSGTGALAIFLKESLGLNLTTSDYDDEQIEDNISYNMHANGEAAVQHIRRK